MKKEAGQKVLLLIDEAQDLSAEALEQLDLLSKLENSQGKLLQIILVGEPELAGILSSSSAGQLGKTFAKKYNLAPLTLLETEDYIRHRISVAAHKNGPPFDASSLSCHPRLFKRNTKTGQHCLRNCPADCIQPQNPQDNRLHYPGSNQFADPGRKRQAHQEAPKIPCPCRILSNSYPSVYSFALLYQRTVQGNRCQP